MSFEDVFGPLRFVVEYECFGCMVEAELKEGGRDILVNWDNREEHVGFVWGVCSGRPFYLR